MAHIYICYSQAETQFKDELVGALQAIYLDRHQFLHEQKVDTDGEVWPGVMDWVAQCDVFMYLLSNESVASKQCRAEFREAVRLGKRILAVQVRDQNKPAGKMGDIPYIDMRDSLDDRQAFERFLQLFNQIIDQLPKKKAEPLASKPISQSADASQGRRAGLPVERDPSGEKRKATLPTRRTGWQAPLLIGGLVVGFALIAAGLIIGSQPSPAPEPTQVAQSLPPKATLIIVPLKTVTPDVFEVAQQVLKQQTAEAVTATAVAENALNAQNTQAAALWTATLTPDITQTLNAILTQWAQATVTEQAHQATTTAEAWTATPSLTPTVKATQAIVSPLMTVDPLTLTQVSLLPPEERIGFVPVAQNSDWAMIERPINGISMVLVPVGCFMMGSPDGDADEQPMTAQCFDRPFWMDKYEVTNRQFSSMGGTASETTASRRMDQPRSNITWDEAQSFCIQRGARLPTEREWEYAARGPSNLVYPWGNDWNENNVVWIGGHTATTGSRPTGASWVGAVDMVGNISEWVSSLYRPYPYEIRDGREGSGAPGVPENHLYRGQYVTFMGDGDFRSANRFEATVPYSADIGFRCVRPIG